ncbi:BppU family phage baseplate upper protein [Carnobacterium maltaromaticum]|uniref:BppU family phage baseplate upper protein n=1 Tax=Carnobacterium maltaromaticum TaxID=2751 RepID=UPI0039BECBE4
MAKWNMRLSTTEPNNPVGLIKVRQSNRETEILSVTMTENSKLKDLTNTKVYFNTLFGKNAVEKKATIIDGKKGKIEFILDDDSMQETGNQLAYFSFKTNDGEIVGTTQNFIYKIESSLMREIINGGAFIASVQEVIDKVQVLADGLSPSAAVGLSNQLAQLDKSFFDELEITNTNVEIIDNTKATINYVDSVLSDIGSGSPQGTFPTLSELISKYPVGAPGLYVVLDEGYFYFWKDTTWSKGGLFQGTEVNYGAVSEPKLSSAVQEDIILLNSSDPKNLNLDIGFNTLKNALVNGYIYIQNIPLLRKGRILLSIKAKKGNGTVCLFRKNNDSNFMLVARQNINLEQGVNRIQTTLTVSGDGNDYVGFISENNFFQKNVSASNELPFRCFVSKQPIPNISNGDNIDVSIVNALEIQGFYAGVESKMPELAKELNLTETQSNVNTIKDDLNQVLIKNRTNSSQNLLTSTSIQSDVFLNELDVDAFSAWGQKMKVQNLFFNSIEIPFHFKKGINQETYLLAAIHLTSDNSLLEAVKINVTNFDFTSKKMIWFKFSSNYNLNQGLTLMVSTINKNGEMLKTGLGIYMTEEMDSNSLTGAKDSVVFSNSTTTYPPNGFSFIGITNPKNYTGFYYNLKNVSESEINESIEVTNAIDNIARNDIELIKGEVGVSIPKALKSFNTLKFRECESNFNNESYFQGRWFKKNVGSIECITTINQGSEIYAKFTGTFINGFFKVLGTESPYIAVSIDGGEFTRLEVTEELELAKNLSDSEHTIRIVVDGIKESDRVWVEGLGLAFDKFSVDENKKVFPIKPFNRNVWFIGDSITAGINVLGTGAIPAVNSASQTFTAFTSNELNLANVRIGFGATGVTKAGSGGVPTAINYVDYMMNGVLENAQSPDFIVINHGTNDAAATSEAFKVAYNELVQRLLIKYPGITIVCMRPFRGNHADSIKEVCNIYSNCFYVDTVDWNITYTDGVHPDVPGSKVAGERLANELKKIFGVHYFIV